MTDAAPIRHPGLDSASDDLAAPGTRRGGKFRWYAQRLRGMSAAEISYRLHERLKRDVSARRAHQWSDFSLGEGLVPKLPEPAANRGAVDAIRPAMESAARSVTSGEVRLMGQAWPLRRSAADWHLDPVTGRHWPRDVFCFDVPFRHDRHYGDPKYMWELNRLQHLQPVAALAHMSGDGVCRDFCLAEIESWMEGNRPFNGLAWATGVEVALRTVSLLTVFTLLDLDTASGETRARLRTCLAAHGYWLARFPSRFSSANNHLIAEAAALFLLGTLWNDLPAAPGYARYGRETLIEQVSRQFHEDGVGAEQSPTYAAFTLEWYLLALYVADRTGRPFPATVRDRLERAAEHLRWITDAGGNQPRIGDDDEGRVLSSGVPEPGYVSSVLGCLSAYLERSELAPPAVTPGLRNLFLGSSEPGENGPSGRHNFDAGGYSVVRSDLAGRKVMLVMDHGPLGHLSIAAHGHADALALWLHIDDQPVLVDAGTFLYHAGGRWRDAFRGTAAHNTLTLDFANSSTIAGPFNWTRKARAWRQQIKHPGGAYAAAGVHDGFEPGFGVLHERAIIENDAGFTIRDRLSGDLKKPAEAQISYLLHPGLDASVHGTNVIVSRNGRRILSINGGCLDVRIHKGETLPPRGWYSPAFGEKVPAAQIVFRGAAATSRDFVTELSIA